MKSLFDKQTSNDLEFGSVVYMLSEACNTEMARKRMLELEPFSKIEGANHALDLASELLQVREEGAAFPRLEF